MMARSIVRDGGCPRCHKSIEDAAHIIVNCPKSKGIWELVGYPHVVSNDFQSWLKENMISTAMFRDIPWSSVFSNLCHEIWKDRNNCVFQAINPSPVNVISQNLSMNMNPKCFVHSQSHLMIHVDASFVSPTDLVGFGGLFEIARVIGCWIKGKKVYANHSLTAQHSAILEAMYCVEAHKLPSPIIYSDCKIAVDMSTEGLSDICLNILNSCTQWIK